MSSMMMNRNTVRSAQTFCAHSACSANNSIMIIMDTILVSIFALISISIRLLVPHTVRNMTTCIPRCYSA